MRKSEVSDIATATRSNTARQPADETDGSSRDGAVIAMMNASLPPS
jgi:hypothetical protein